MGRTSGISRRAELDNETSSGNRTEPPPKETFPRRFPRLGNQFQTKLPKSTDPLQRASPELLSHRYPHLTEFEAREVISGENATANDVASGVQNQHRQDQDPSSRRGGRLLHTPSSDTDCFPRYVQPLIESFNSDPPVHVTDDIWKQHMVQLHNIETPGKKRSRASRGGTKRKRGTADESDELIWNIEDLVRKIQAGDTAQQSRYMLGEDDACALEFLHTQHRGNTCAAKINTLANLSAGRAMKIRKCNAKRRLRDRTKAIPPSTSESWRKKYENMQFDTILANFDDTEYSCYTVSASESDPNPRVAHGNLELDRDDLKGVWRSILACGKAMELHLEADDSSRKKMLLSTVLFFVRNAYGLPTPESCFGTHHVIIEEVSSCLLKILDHIDIALDFQARLRDKLFCESGDGIDSDGLFKFIEVESKLCSIRLDDAVHLFESKQIVIEWEERASSLLDSCEDSVPNHRDELKLAEALATEAKSHGYISKALVQLNLRIQKAYGLRERIVKWQESCNGGEKGTIRSVAALVRESNRVKLVFPEVSELLSFHNQVESWVDRANVAIRSRISLGEIEELIIRGEEMPLDLSDYVEKLRSRVATALDWQSALDEVVPISRNSDGEPDWLQWLCHVRRRLHDGMHGQLHDLASEGSRIPVEVDAVKLLQVELDAKSWTQKAWKWIPKNNDSRRGKLAEIRDHVTKARALRERLVLPENQRKEWVLDGESELIQIVQAADSWYEKYKIYLEGDNRRNQRRCCLSIRMLRKIVDEANSIHANIGNASIKIARILGQAEAWYNEHRTLLERCEGALSGRTSQTPSVNLSDISKAVESAESDVSLDLEEARTLKSLAEKTRSWYERVGVAAPKRSKRQGRAARPKITADDFAALIQEASFLPVDTEDGVQRLQSRLLSVVKWQEEAATELVKVATCFGQLRDRLNLGFGMPNEFSLDRKSSEDEDAIDETANTEICCNVEKEDTDSDKCCPDELASQSDTLSIAGSECEPGAQSVLDRNNANVHKVTKALIKGAKSHGVITREVEAVEVLESVSQWCLRSLRYLRFPREVFDKRYFGAFDRFIKEGQELSDISNGQWSDQFGQVSWNNLGVLWGEVVNDQLERLDILRQEREKFIDWCNVATQILNDEKKLTLDRLEGLAQQSRCFPAVSDTVQKVRGLSVKAKAWAQKVRMILDSDKKISMQDAKSLLDAGEKLRVNAQEIRIIRTSLRAARGWMNRVKRCNLEQGSVHVNSVKDLIEEHQSFLIEMPDELSRLQQATQSYCVCRRPYSGFMIGCDECEEWYHGSCIGISESRADRFDKYICIRCSIRNIFKNSSLSAVRIVRKWTSKADKKKSRQIEYQKHQRKVRKETKDIEKFREEIRKLDSFSKCGLSHAPASNASSVCGAEENGQIGEIMPAEESPSSTEEEAAEIEIDKMQTIEDTTKSLKEAEVRLEMLRKAQDERKRTNSLEDWKADSIRRWCIRVRSLVLAPPSQELAEQARPLPNGELSEPMLSLVADATILGVSGLPDVDAMLNYFKCMSWSLFALSIVRRKATLDELESVVSQASALRLPDEKPLRTIKVMIQKAQQWQGKIRKALTPKPGQTKPLNIDMLNTLLVSVEESAVLIPEMMQLKSAISDRGARHCICGGPNYGSFMLCCDRCELWFHGSCVKTDKDSESLDKWLCCACRGTEFPPLPENLEELHCMEAQPGIFDIKQSIPRGDCSPHAPEPDKLWPPFKFDDENFRVETLGLECLSYPDDCEPLFSTAGSPLPNTFFAAANQEAHVQGKLPDGHNLTSNLALHCRTTQTRQDPTKSSSANPGKLKSVGGLTNSWGGTTSSADSIRHTLGQAVESKPPLLDEPSPELNRTLRDTSDMPGEMPRDSDAQNFEKVALHLGDRTSEQKPPMGSFASDIMHHKARNVNAAVGIGIHCQNFKSSSRDATGIKCASPRSAPVYQAPHEKRPIIRRRMDADGRFVDVDGSSAVNTLQAASAGDTRGAETEKSTMLLGGMDRSRAEGNFSPHDASYTNQTGQSSENKSSSLTTEIHKEEKIDDHPGIHLSYASLSSAHLGTEILLPHAEQNVTVTPSSSVQIFDPEANLDRSDGVDPEALDDRSEDDDIGSHAPDQRVCFDASIPSGNKGASRSLSRPITDLRVPLKEASA